MSLKEVTRSILRLGYVIGDNQMQLDRLLGIL
jgi:hypothetical protein